MDAAFATNMQGPSRTISPASNISTATLTNKMDADLIEFRGKPYLNVVDHHWRFIEQPAELS